MARMIKSFLLFIPCMLLSEENIWKTIHDKREYSISGVALFKDGYIVVHDNEEKQEARISYLDKKLNISKLISSLTNNFVISEIISGFLKSGLSVPYFNIVSE